jgi:hypothetical protein
MEVKQIALPDSYATYDILKPILAKQGYELRNMDVQSVRLLDVFVVAPFLFYVGTRKELPQTLRLGLIVLAAATLIYNGKNYLDALQD